VSGDRGPLFRIYTILTKFTVLSCKVTLLTTLYQLQRLFSIIRNGIMLVNANCGSATVYDYASVQLNIFLEKAMKLPRPLLPYRGSNQPSISYMVNLFGASLRLAI
jgi:hypothetical protein